MCINNVFFILKEILGSLLFGISWLCSFPTFTLSSLITFSLVPSLLSSQSIPKDSAPKWVPWQSGSTVTRLKCTCLYLLTSLHDLHPKLTERNSSGFKWVLMLICNVLWAWSAEYLSVVFSWTARFLIACLMSAGGLSSHLDILLSSSVVNTIHNFGPLLTSSSVFLKCEFKKKCHSASFSHYLLISNLSLYGLQTHWGFTVHYKSEDYQ